MTRRRRDRERRWRNRTRRAWWVRGTEWLWTQAFPREERISRRRQLMRRLRVVWSQPSDIDGLFTETP